MTSCPCLVAEADSAGNTLVNTSLPIFLDNIVRRTEPTGTAVSTDC